MTGTVEDSLASRAGRLFEQYQNGDAAKMGDLVKVLTPILWHTVRATRLDAATAEDVIQTTWLTLVHKSASIQEPRAVLQWLVVTAKRESWRVSRAQQRTRPEDLATDERLEKPISMSVEPVSVEDEVVTDNLNDNLWRHLEDLPERCRTLLRVIAFADRPDYAAISVALGMPQGSIGPTRGRCLAKLRAALADDPTWEA